MTDAFGVTVRVGDAVRIYLREDLQPVGTVTRWDRQFIYVSIPDLWEREGGMLPVNVVAIYAEVDIGL